MNDNKRKNGQFFTITNPFKVNAFSEWYNNIPDIENEVILEPFAGSNNIIEMIENINVQKPKGWVSYDIEPPEENKYPEYKVIERDTIENFPKGYSVSITNPPYLARNSATRRGLSFPDTTHDDVYKESLEQMLNNVGYIAVIIPESYITSGLFRERLSTVISLSVEMFDDTECPVCLALFNPEETESINIYRMDLLLGTMDDLTNELDIITKADKELNKIWKFNDPNGDIAIKLVDDTKKDSIYFTEGKKIDPSKIKPSSRALTRVSGPNLSEKEIKELIAILNELISSYREKTQDVFMTSFKGLREDGKYRRRLDFKTSRSLLTKGLEILRA